MSSIFPGDLWSIGEAQVNGLPVVVRFRTGLPAEPARQRADNLIIISWPYAGIDSGMPNDEDKQHTNRFEEAIEKGFDDSAIGVQVACLTGNHQKEWRCGRWRRWWSGISSDDLFFINQKSNKLPHRPSG